MPVLALSVLSGSPSFSSRTEASTRDCTAQAWSRLAGVATEGLFYFPFFSFSFPFGFGFFI
jgi:hypothetical protein